MRKNYILLPLLVLPSMLFSNCQIGKGEFEKVLLSFGDVHTSKVTDIDAAEFQDLVSNKESFMIVVSSNTCTCWSAFKPIIEKYISDNKLICYHIDYNSYSQFESTFGLGCTSSTTTFAIYDRGCVKETIRSDKNKNMEDYNSFVLYINTRVILPKCFYISEEDVDYIKTNEKNAVIYYARSKCGDCSYINPTILRDYVIDHPNMNTLYVLECQPWKSLDSTAYQNKKDSFGLSELNNSTYGYSTGVFPYFSLIEKGEYASGCVIFNEEITKNDNAYTVSDAYYSASRLPNLTYLNNDASKVLVGKVIPNDEINDQVYYFQWKHEFAQSFYKPILYSFLDYSLPKLNYKL